MKKLLTTATILSVATIVQFGGTAEAASATYTRGAGTAPVLDNPTNLTAGNWTEVAGTGGNYRQGVPGNPADNSDATQGSTRWRVDDVNILDERAINIRNVTMNITRTAPPPGFGAPVNIMLRVFDTTGAPFVRVNFGATMQALSAGTGTTVFNLGGIASLQNVPIGTQLRFVIDVVEPVGGVIDSITFNNISIFANPEPASLLMMASVFGIAAWIRRRRMA